MEMILYTISIIPLGVKNYIFRPDGAWSRFSIKNL